MYELVLQFLTQIFGLMYSVLTEDLSDFSPHSYEYISILNTILKGFASSLMLIAFCVGYIQSAVSLIEQKTPIAIFKTLARLVIVNALVVRGTDIILMPMFSVVRSLTSRLIEAMGGQAGLLPNIDESSPGGVAGAIGELLSINILTGILYIAVIISGLVLLLTVFGRFLKIYVYMSIAPVPLAFFAGGNVTSAYGRNYIKNVFGVCMEAVTMVIAIQLFCAIADDAVMTQVGGMLGFLGTMAKPVMLLLYLSSLSAIIKGADNMTHKLLGLSLIHISEPTRPY